MANPTKSKVLDDLQQRFGEVRKLKGSESLFVIGDEAARIYFRYSKVHERGRTFFGLREVDLRQLEGHNSFLCFLLDDGSPPVFVPYADFEEVFANAEAARDGQYKVQLTSQAGALELYVAGKADSTSRRTLDSKPSSVASKPRDSEKRLASHIPRYRRFLPELATQKDTMSLYRNLMSGNWTGPSPGTSPFGESCRKVTTKYAAS